MDFMRAHRDTDANRDPIFVMCILDQLVGLASAIKTMHRKKYRHGDLKPQNILVFTGETNVGIWKVADLGLTKCHHEATGDRIGPTSILGQGTISYEPPEVATFSESPRSRLYDIWSMGCIIFQLVVCLLYGEEELTKLGHSTRSPKNQSSYWQASWAGEKSRWMNPKMHPQVEKLMNKMEKDFRSGKESSMNGTSALLELTRLVKTRLLVVQLPKDSKKASPPGCRARADDLCSELEEIQEQLRKNVLLMREPSFDERAGSPLSISDPGNEAVPLPPVNDSDDEAISLPSVSDSDDEAISLLPINNSDNEALSLPPSNDSDNEALPSPLIDNFDNEAILLPPVNDSDNEALPSPPINDSDNEALSSQLVRNSDNEAQPSPPVNGFDDAALPSQPFDNSDDENMSLVSVSDALGSTTSATTISSIGSQRLSLDITLALADLLLQDRELKDLLFIGLQKTSRDKIQRNYRRMLRKFAEDLKQEAKDPIELRVGKHARRKVSAISGIIISRLDPNREDKIAQIEDQTPQDVQLHRDERLTSLVQSIQNDPGNAWAEPQQTIPPSNLEGEPPEEDEEASDESEDEDAAPKLYQLKKFVSDSKALCALRIRLERFVSMGRELEPEQLADVHDENEDTAIDRLSTLELWLGTKLICVGIEQTNVSELIDFVLGALLRPKIPQDYQRITWVCVSHLELLPILFYIGMI